MSTFYVADFDGNNGLDFRVRVVDDEGIRPLPHTVIHSPCGFSWGYHGSGPTDLAWNLFAHVLDVSVDEIEPEAAHLFRDAWVSNRPMGDGWCVAKDTLVAWVDAEQAKYEAAEAAAVNGPQNGIDFCYCGAKYWDANWDAPTCASCGEAWTGVSAR